MSFEEDFDEELEPVKSKTPSSKTPSTGKKLTLYFMSTSYLLMVSYLMGF